MSRKKRNIDSFNEKWKIPSNTEVDKMKREALLSSVKESFFVVGGGDRYRIGVNVEVADLSHMIFSIEFLLKATPNIHLLEQIEMEKIIDIERILMEKGYSICYEDGWWIMFEKIAIKDDIQSECKSLIRKITETDTFNDLFK